ncbi:MFS transporter [Nonomuraea endophytica]|uniref:MFS family permease n=1 Tax=Nonomuraea endophytica TaxID=714136 RepID=A0A7W8EFG9_9ACTN|nr:MFS transporter [Nonomuraea endophytica]MBB5077336.1 MFS family permease [Nonomuraea endophytica]
MRSFRFLWSSSALSNLADGVLKVGTPLLAVTLTRSPAEVALAGVATTLPWLLLALPAGAVADRQDRRRIMVLANAFRAALLVAVAAFAWSGTLSLWILLAVVLLSGMAEVFADTSAQSVLPMTVPSDRLAWANGRIVGAQTVGNDFIGSPLAGVLVTLLPPAILGAPGILYGAAGLLLLGMRGTYRPTPAVTSTPTTTLTPATTAAPAVTPTNTLATTTSSSQPATTVTHAKAHTDASHTTEARPASTPDPACSSTPDPAGSPGHAGPDPEGAAPSDPEPSGAGGGPGPHRRSLMGDVAEGLRYLWAHRFLRLLAISSGMLNLGNAAFFAVFVLWVVGPGSRMELSPAAYGLMMTTFAVGAVGGSFVSDQVIRWGGEGRTLVGSWLASSLLLAAPILTPHPAVLFPVAVLWGATNTWSNVIVISTRQRIIPEGLLGRVNSAYRLIGMGGMPIGAGVAGLMGETWGLLSVFIASVAICLTAVALIARAIPAFTPSTPHP